MNTVESMVLRGDKPDDTDADAETPRRRLTPRTILALVVLLGTIIVSFNWTLPYYALAPGSARNVGGLIEATGVETYPAEGQVLLTTVSLQQVHPVEALVGWLRTDVDVLPADEILPPETSNREYREANVEVMADSKQSAVIVALRRLGYTVAEKGQGALVERVTDGLPASGLLRQGEVIKAIDGRPVALVTDATAAITAHAPGDVVAIDLAMPDGSAPRTVQVTLGSNPQQDGKAVLGVVLRTLNLDFDLPFKVEIRSGDIGGPSAGLAFTLGVLDGLTPGELTGGRKVAVTGTMQLDGTVGDVGGVAQKTSAVRSAGAQVFLVPPGEYEVARQRAGDKLQVFAVATLQDALNVLASLGGDVAALDAAAASRQG